MQNQVEQLLSHALALVDYELQLPLLREAVRLADVAGLEQLAFDARQEFITAANFSGRAEESLVAFHWCLARWDADPDSYSSYSMIWRFKWIASALTDYPEVSVDKIYEMEDEFAVRCERMGYNQRQIYKLKYLNRRDLGCAEEVVDRFFDLWRQTPRDILSDCSVCDEGAEILHLVQRDRHEEAVLRTEEMLSGWRSCANYPMLTYGNVLRSLVELGRLDQARQYHLTAYRQMAGKLNFLTSIAEHIDYLVRAGDLTRAIRIFEKNFCLVLESKNPDDHRVFYMSAAFLMEALTRRRPRLRLIRLPQRFEGYRDDDRYDTRQLAERFLQKTFEIAARFDQRNGNDYVSAGIISNRKRILGE